MPFDPILWSKISNSGNSGNGGGGLPVIEITSISSFDQNGARLSESECMALDAAADARTPCILKMALVADEGADPVKIACAANWFNLDGAMYVADLTAVGMNIFLTESEDAWVVDFALAQSATSLTE